MHKREITSNNSKNTDENKEQKGAFFLAKEVEVKTKNKQ